jgi:putative hydrolase of the HAD superfamily
VKAVIFDLGGVVLESPLPVIARHEQAAGLEAGSINRQVLSAGGNGAWARLERGQTDRATFFAEFSAELEGRITAAGLAGMFSEIEASVTVRPGAVAAVRALRRSGLRVAALTNDWDGFPAGGLVEEFDVFCESARLGTRKPEPEIYLACLSQLEVAAAGCVMLDDLGVNLKTARKLGMATIKVGGLPAALAELEAVLDLPGLFSTD